MVIAPQKPILLWSASNAMKFRISRDYLGAHRVWCSPVFEAASAGRYQPGGTAAASSDPASIYRALHKDVTTKDKHSDAIKRQKDSLTALALQFKADGKLDDTRAAEIVALLDKAEVADWRPLLYVIPYTTVENRLIRVPASQWAAMEPEFIVPDLTESEFHVIEPWPCH